ncbi:thiamine pyrophosphokinase [Pedobacter yulinensis]|uniref:Thiamine pyrophosphokinase n=1 Tax=Pedobacter yulinensis TaxID=2126353 RepID=A0A2T3HRU6_9SPHI|nr:thiamine pyrophosphokinase [Pedobacter yulinensis]PST85190.1 thiamine pyrophosphokinase [Pedobacter yulinensis]
MSSHHIIREKQEPALYIHDLGNFSEELLGQLLEWSPTVIVHGAAYEKIDSLGIKIDAVVHPAEALLQENTQVIGGTAEATSLVLDHLIKGGYPAVNIITPQHDLKFLTAYSSLITIVVFSETEKTYAIQSGFSVWKPKDSIFKILGNSYIEVTNLKMDGEPAEEEEEQDYHKEHAHTPAPEFRVIEDGFVVFEFAGEPIFISEKL